MLTLGVQAKFSLVTHISHRVKSDLLLKALFLKGATEMFLKKVCELLSIPPAKDLSQVFKNELICKCFPYIYTSAGH